MPYSQKLVEKEKRRKRDDELKKQAKIARRHKIKSAKKSSKNTKIPVSKDEQKSGHLDAITKALLESTGPLPDLLPDELLQSIPSEQPMENTTSIIASTKRRKFLDCDSNAPKDIKRGHIHIRVLEDLKMVLPPKSSKSSIHLKNPRFAGTGSGTSRRRVAWGKKPFVVAKKTVS